jgi:hypothetical protein
MQTATDTPKKKIAVRCKAALTLELQALTPLQGDLKELSGKNFQKLRSSIIKHGICFPFFVWQSEGKNYVLDGTQRDRVLKKMSEDGYEVPRLPCALIQAKDRKDAARKILLISSRYGRMTEESLDEFLSENDLSFLELSDELELPDVDGRYFSDPNGFGETGEGDQGKLDEKNPVTCQQCGCEFVP